MVTYYQYHVTLFAEHTRRLLGTYFTYFVARVARFVNRWALFLGVRPIKTMATLFVGWSQTITTARGYLS